MSFSPPVDPNISFLTSGFGVRTSRRTGRPTFHAGVDFRGSTGDPIFAVADGVVDLVREDAQGRRGGTYGYGACCSIQHGALDQWTVYAHLSEVLVGPGDVVQAGQLIGRCGRSSNGKFPRMGAHLHFEVRNPRPDGSSPFPGPYRRYNIDPQPWLEARGITLRRRGFELAPSVVNPSQGLSGLGNVSSTLDLDAEGLPEEPIRDPFTFKPIEGQTIVVMTVAAATAVGVGAFLLFRSS